MSITLTGTVPIPSAETFDLPTVAEGQIAQTIIFGTTPIPSGEYFVPQDGVFMDPLTIPASIFGSF